MASKMLARFFIFFLVGFLSTMQRNTKVSSSTQPDNANGRAGTNAAQTISTLLCSVPGAAPAAAAAAVSLPKAVCTRKCMEGAAGGAALPAPGFPRARVLEEAAEMVAGCGSGSFRGLG